VPCCFLLRAGDEFKLTGRGVIGYRDGDGWELENALEFP
jgi:hypothetical protein